uniref:EGF_CA domain-containing protein n=1 Tax=Macrostomum lignano TaxID=282301 RepID=A0A1I8IAV5_9PLAT
PRRTCAEFGHTCQAGCRDTESGSFECVCPPGTRLLWKLDAARIPCPGDQQCLNTIGSYECRVIRCRRSAIITTPGQRVCAVRCDPGDAAVRQQLQQRRPSQVHRGQRIAEAPPEFTMRIIDSHNANLRNCIYRLLDNTEGRVTIVRTTNDLAGKLGKMYDMKIRVHCYRTADHGATPIFQTTFNVYISISAFNYGCRRCS